MIKKHLRNLIDSDELILGAEMRFGSPAIAEFFSKSGFDFLTIDTEHSPQYPIGIQAQLQAIDCGPAVPIVRANRNDPVLFKLYLDMGAMGVFVPHIDTPEQAQIGARACRYAPRGYRGYGPTRANNHGLEKDYFEQINDNVVYIANIESATAVKNIDDILAVDGLDAVIIGWADLSLTMDVPPLDYDHPKMQDAIKTIVKAAQKAGKPAGMACIPDQFERYIEMGFRIMYFYGDEWLIASSCTGVMETFNSIKNR